jgi:pyruvate/2-oxoglutarate dehydrogenase complex dihydrolipoamide acyltransferase (E2) component
MDILMPQLGETVLEGTVAAWHKNAGDVVEKGEMLLDVETDKAATEIEAPASGVLTNISVGEGSTVDVGTVLATIAVEGEVAEATAAPVATTPMIDAAASRPAGLPAKSPAGKVSPVVRRLLKQHKLDIADIPGTGRDGRVSKQDVENFVKGSSVAPGTVTVSERIPFDRFRKVTAEHMVRSKATSAHVLQAIDVDFTAIDAVRLSRKDRWKNDKGYSLSYLPFVARAVCLALTEFPRINASVDGDALLVHKDIDLAIAIDLNHEGLVAPVVRNAGGASVSELAESFADLVARAKTRTLSADELQGGSYTLSNPGPFGTLFTAPIINQPQVGILSMDTVKKRAHVVEREAGDAIEIRPVGILAHSFDHRAIDGAYSAAYLQKLKSIIEDIDWNSEF